MLDWVTCCSGVCHDTLRAPSYDGPFTINCHNSQVAIDQAAASKIEKINNQFMDAASTTHAKRTPLTEYEQFVNGFGTGRKDLLMKYMVIKFYGCLPKRSFRWYLSQR